MSHQGEGTSEAIFFLFASIRTWGGLSPDTKHFVRGAVYHWIQNTSYAGRFIPGYKTLCKRGGLSQDTKHLVRGAVYPRIKTLRMRGGLSPDKKHFHV